jgi:hypothetical protein
MKIKKSKYNKNNNNNKNKQFINNELDEETQDLLIIKDEELH